MDNENPYRAPSAQNINGADADVPQEVKIFSIKGRIGRVRYITYSIGLSLLIGVVAAILGAVSAGLAIIPAYIALLVISVMLTVQRCHDFNASGWLALLMLVPLINLIFWFMPGTDGANRWGNKTPPNSTGLVIATWLVALIVPIGIIAAIAIPQYQQYVQRAKAVQAR